MSKPLSYATHRRMVPLYHYFVIGVLAANVVVQLWAAGSAVASGTDIASSVFALLVAAALLVLAFFVRMFPITVQDRVIRLEQQLRLRRLLPAQQHAQIDALTLKQLIALRFASDGEAAELVAFCHANPNASADDVKKRIRVWVADPLRI